MKRIRMVATVLSLLAVLCLTWTATGLATVGEPAAPADVEAYQLLVNPSMEQPFVPYDFWFRNVQCQTAAGWSRFGDVAPRPCWMDARVFAHQVMGTDWVEKIDGDTSQVVISTEPYVAGIYQRATVTAGLPYGFHAAMMTIFQSSYGPPQPGHMIKQVGMDPTGGTNPNAPTVVWSEPEDQDYGWDVQRRTAVVATSGTMTVFIRVTSLDDPGEWPYVNQSYFDSAILARTATVSAVSPPATLATTFTVRWDNAVASPEATIVWYDVQWMDEADGQWVDWLTWTTLRQAAFTGQRGHTYRFRARAWQKYPNDAYLFSPWGPEAGARTWIAGAQLVGKVWGNGSYAFGGARVSILDTAYTTLSRGDGSYQLLVDVMEEPHRVAVSNLPWLAPEPVYGVALGLGETVTLDWMLRPPDDAVENGGFEANLDPAWEIVAEEGAAPVVAAEPVHTGVGAARLGGVADPDRAVGYASGLEQTVTLERSWNPNLSFWYLAETDDDGDEFRVRLESAALPLDLSFTPSLDGDGWQRQWTSLGMGQAYFTGTVTIYFEVWNDGDESPTTVYLDEVSLGRTPGGPFRSYLPLIRR